jgi:DNA polymerase III gamma/tau subunit
MLEQVAAYAGGAVDAALVDAAFGATGRQYARALVEAILAGDAARALHVVAEASDAGADMFGLVRGAIGEYRNVLVARVDQGLLSRDLSPADAEAVVALAAATPQPRVVRGLRLLADALASGRLSGSPRLELETAVLRLVIQTEDPSLEALATRVALLEQGQPSASPAPVAAAPRAAALPPPPAERRAESRKPAPAATVPIEPPPLTAAAGPPTLQQIRSQWDQIRLRADERHKPLRAPLARATVDAVDDQSLTIGMPDELQATIAREKLSVIEDAVAEVIGRRLRIVVRARTPATSAHRATPAASAAAGDASASAHDGEIDLLAYARKKLGGTETT